MCGINSLSNYGVGLGGLGRQKRNKNSMSRINHKGAINIKLLPKL